MCRRRAAGGFHPCIQLKKLFFKDGHIIKDILYRSEEHCVPAPTMSSIAFSICIPVYNTKKYLTECLASALAQNYANYEILIVDDGSTDGSGAVCDEYQQQHKDFIQVYHQKNQGLISARRKAIANAQGDYLVFLDSDDMLVPNALETLANKLDETNADIILYHYYSCASDNCTYIKVDKRLPFKDNDVFAGDSKAKLYDAFIQDNSLNMMWMKCIRRELVQSDPLDYGQFRLLNVCEDLLQSLWPMTEAKKVVYISSPLYVYRINSGSLTHNLKVDSMKSKSAVHVFNHFLTFLPRWGRDTKEIHDLLENRWFHSICHVQFLCLRDCASGKEKDSFFSFDWKSMVPKEALEHLWDNPHILSEDRDWWLAVEMQDMRKLNRLLFKKRLYVYRQYFKVFLNNICHPRRLMLKIKAHLS